MPIEQLKESSLQEQAGLTQELHKSDKAKLATKIQNNMPSFAMDVRPMPGATGPNPKATNGWVVRAEELDRWKELEKEAAAWHYSRKK